MRYAIVYEEDSSDGKPAELGHGNFFRFACDDLNQAEEWAREAIKEGPKNKSRATVYEYTRPMLKYINIEGEAVRIEVPVQARISAELQSVK